MYCGSLYGHDTVNIATGNCTKILVKLKNYFMVKLFICNTNFR